MKRPNLFVVSLVLAGAGGGWWLAHAPRPAAPTPPTRAASADAPAAPTAGAARAAADEPADSRPADASRPPPPIPDPELTLDAPAEPLHGPREPVAPEERLLAHDERGLPARAFGDVLPAYAAMAERRLRDRCGATLGGRREVRLQVAFEPVAQGRFVAATRVQVRPEGADAPPAAQCAARALEGLAFDADALVKPPGGPVRVALTLGAAT